MVGVLGSMKRKAASLVVLLLFAASLNALAAPFEAKRRPPPPPPGGSGPCYQCLKSCYDTYQKNVKDCGQTLACLDLALAEHDACVGICYSDVC